MKTLHDIAEQLHRIEYLWRFECAANRYEVNRARYEKAYNIYRRYRDNMREWLNAAEENRKGYTIDGFAYEWYAKVPREVYTGISNLKSLFPPIAK